jgi:hypothetical protein
MVTLLQHCGDLSVNQASFSFSIAGHRASQEATGVDCWHGSNAAEVRGREVGVNKSEPSTYKTCLLGQLHSALHWGWLSYDGPTPAAHG